ncbi:NADH-ubiquinone oxidoreductase chain N [hydrothermal vent metagenome]|uniref:NADH-ubiquinone oxidoreductase chain N n=1 Tax=hydrothermal vent metagenome TaxID=652676 RepID=A0A3B0TTX1_9ZZZZ
MGRDLSLLLPELILMITVTLMLIGEMVRFSRVVLAIGLIGLALATWQSYLLLGADTFVFGGTYRINYIAIWSKLILLPATGLSLLLARGELAGRFREGSVYSLMVLVSLGALMLSGSGDVMLIVLGVVLTGLGSFALVAYPADDAATEASMKFLVYGSVAGAVMIYGVTFWYAGAGSTLFSALVTIGDKPLLAAAGLLALLVGLGYKAALVPFRFSALDVYVGAPITVAAYMSVVTKLAAIFALAQVFTYLPIATGWQWAIAILAAISMTYGYLTALVQSNLVRLLAYSSIAQSGYFLLGLVAIGFSALALDSLIIFGAAYAAMNIGAFAIILVGGRDMDKFTGLGRRSPMVGVAMVVFLLSLAGIPPLFGFFGKALLFGAAIEAGFLWLVIIAILNSVLSLAVYLRVIVAMYMSEKVTKHAHEVEAMPKHKSDMATTIVWVLTLAITLLSGLITQVFTGAAIF